MTKEAYSADDEIRGKVRKGFEPLSRRDIMLNRVAVFTVAAALALTTGKDAAKFAFDKIEQGANTVTNVIGGINQASQEAGAGHPDVPSTEEGLTRAAQETIRNNEQSQAAANHRP